MKNSTIIDDVDRYYTAKVIEHGGSAQGVDWNSTESQFLRFQQLLKVISPKEEFYHIADLGCGYGALIEQLDHMNVAFNYDGYDVSGEMLKRAKKIYGNRNSVCFINDSIIHRNVDYVVASGIFNVRLRHSDEEWYDYIQQTLDMMDRSCRKGFAFNMLTAYSDADKMRDNLYYAQPEDFFALAKKKYSRNVALLHDYDLYEFTLLVHKLESWS